MTLEGDDVTLDALDHAKALMQELEDHPNDWAGHGALQDVLSKLDDLETQKPLSWSIWSDHSGELPRREWLVSGWLPAGRVCLMTGLGGIGKSRLILQLAAGIASGGGQGGEWIEAPLEVLRLGSAVGSEGERVVYATWEDEPEEVYRRLSEISGVAAPWVTPERLRKLHVVDMEDQGPIWAPLQGRHIATLAELTPTGARIRAHCEEHGARLLIVDPLAAAYAGDENSRGLVRAFIANWDAWGRAHDCSVLLVAHPPKSGALFSGSTDWQGAVRSMWTLTKESRHKTKKGDDEDQEWKLSLEKSNYGPQLPALRVEWDDAGGARRWEVFGSWKEDTLPRPKTKNNGTRSSYDPFV